MSFDYSKLRGRIREYFCTQENFSKALKMSATSLSAKLNNDSEFSQLEINKARELLKIEVDEIPTYFFTPIVQ